MPTSPITKVHPLPKEFSRTVGLITTKGSSSGPLDPRGPGVLRAVKTLLGIVSELRRRSRQRTATAYIHESGRHLRHSDFTFIDYNPEASCVVDASGAILYANSQFQSLFDGSSVFSLIHSRDQRRFREELQERNPSLTTVEQCMTVSLGYDNCKLEQLFDWSVGCYMGDYFVLTAR